MRVARAAALAVIAKAPEPGRCKTRLCPPLTPLEAAGLAEAALRDTLVAVALARAGRRVIVLDGDPGPWLAPGIEVIAQRGHGLDERLANAFADLGGPALILGMDTPQVRPAGLEAALAALERNDAVIGAADDGGYWAIGLRRADPSVFLGVPMSTSTTGAAQRARLRSLGLGWSELGTLCDVDTIADAQAVAAGAPWTRFAAALAGVSSTAEALGAAA